MSIANLWNHRAVLYRFPAESLDPVTGDPVEPTPTVQTTPSGLNARPRHQLGTPLADTPIGEQQVALYIWFLDKGFTDIHERDILDVVSGPESPTRYRIASVTKPAKASSDVHHVEVATHVYTGNLT